MVAELYRAGGQYWFRNGVNVHAMIALGLGILPNVPGFLVECGILSKGSAIAPLAGLYSYAWFIGFFVSGVSYWALSSMERARVGSAKVLARQV